MKLKIEPWDSAVIWDSNMEVVMTSSEFYWDNYNPYLVKWDFNRGWWKCSELWILIDFIKSKTSGNYLLNKNNTLFLCNWCKYEIDSCKEKMFDILNIIRNSNTRKIQTRENWKKGRKNKKEKNK